MKKIFLLTLICIIGSLSLYAQQFEPAPSEFQNKLEKYIGRYGTPERMYLLDAKNKTFDGRGGELYIVAFVYDINTKTKRRMMVYEIGSAGEKKNPKYPDYSNSIRADGSNQMFHVRLDAQGDASAITKFKIDADAAATVYIYRLIRGVK
jgi:hypothetical protein